MGVERESVSSDNELLVQKVVYYSPPQSRLEIGYHLATTAVTGDLVFTKMVMVAFSVEQRSQTAQKRPLNSPKYRLKKHEDFSQPF